MTHAEQANKKDVGVSYALGLAVVIFCGFVAYLIFLQDEWLRTLFSDFATVSIGMLAALSLGYGAWCSRTRSRRLAAGWGILALAVFFWALGDLCYAILEMMLGKGPFPSVADLFYFAYYPLFLGGLLYLPATRIEGGERLKILLDMGVVMVAALLVLLNFFIGPLIMAGNLHSLLVEILALAYPVFDFVLLGALLELLLRRERARQGPLLLLGGSAMLMILSDSIFGYQSVAQSYVSGSAADISYVASSLLAALAGVVQARDVKRKPASEAAPTAAEESVGRAFALWRLILPYAWFGGAFALLVWSHDNRTVVDFGSLALGVGFIILLVMIRQILALRENAALYTQLRAELAQRQRAEADLRVAQGALEKRVLERTAELSAANRRLQQEIGERERAESERQKLQVKVQQTQKLESLGVLAGGIAHDFNNLLAVILGNTDLMERDLEPGSPGSEGVREIEKAALQAAKLTKQMLCYSGKGVFVLQVVTLTEIIDGMKRLLRLSVAPKTTLTFELAPDLPPVEADLTQVRQVILDLVINAAEAVGDASGQIMVRTGHAFCTRADLAEIPSDEELPEGEYAYVEVADTGCGMTAEVKARLFEPFFTTKFTGRGLGLAAVLGIVRGHHGAIKVTSEVGYGSTFRVMFPVSRKLGEIVPPPPALVPDNRKTILVIDDEDALLPLCRQILERAGYSVLTARDGPQGLLLFREHADKIGLVIADYAMPELNGEQVLNEIWRVSPQTKAILSSGYGEKVMSSQLVARGDVAWLQKPFMGRTLIDAVYKVIGQPALVPEGPGVS